MRYDYYKRGKFRNRTFGNVTKNDFFALSARKIYAQSDIELNEAVHTAM